MRDDIPRVIDLHRRVFPTQSSGPASSESAYGTYFEGIFFDNPWYDEAQPSLVYEGAGGRIIGFLGVMPRPMSVDGRALRVAVSSQFMVEAESRSTLAAVQLIKEFLSGPQALSLADEASHGVQELWEGLGGTTVPLYSLHWARVLHPGRFALSRLARCRRLEAVARAARPVGRVVDAVVARLPHASLHPAKPPLAAGQLDYETLAQCLSTWARGRALRPEYESRSLKWLLEVLAQKPGGGTFCPTVLRDAAGDVAGWYLCHFNPGDIGEVVQVGARDGALGDVLDHLFHEAWRRGVLALTGRFDPGFIRELSERLCVFHHRGQWMLVHARRPDVLDAIHRGDAQLTRLEGEWCMRFRAGYA